MRTRLRATALTVTYNLLIRLRGLAWRLLRPRAIGVRALVTRGDEVLLVRHRGGAAPWGLPGGGVDRGEPLAAAALREVAEESGCPATVSGLHGVFHHFATGLSDYIVVFACAAHGPPRPPAGDLEIAEARFFARDALPPGTDAGSARRIAEHGRGERGLYQEW